MPTCPSIHQSEASRRNGALSAGPVTLDGKARSAANATRHGLRAGPFRLFANEDPATFEALFQALLARHNPADAVERHWVEQLGYGDTIPNLRCQTFLSPCSTFDAEGWRLPVDSVLYAQEGVRFTDPQARFISWSGVARVPSGPDRHIDGHLSQGTGRVAYQAGPRLRSPASARSIASRM